MSATRKEVYDAYGNLIWIMDGRGFITRLKYDVVTGAVTQRIDDVDTAQVSDEPAGWETPTGGGYHLVTDFPPGVPLRRCGKTLRDLVPACQQGKSG